MKYRSAMRLVRCAQSHNLCNTKLKKCNGGAYRITYITNWAFVMWRLRFIRSSISKAQWRYGLFPLIFFHLYLVVVTTFPQFKKIPSTFLCKSLGWPKMTSWLRPEYVSFLHDHLISTFKVIEAFNKKF